MGAFQIVACTYESWIASFLAMTIRVAVIARNEAIQKTKKTTILNTHLQIVVSLPATALRQIGCC